MYHLIHELLFPILLLATQFLPPVRALYARSFYRVTGNTKKFQKLSRTTQQNSDQLIAVGRRVRGLFAFHSPVTRGRYREIGSVGNITAIHTRIQRNQGKSSRQKRSKGAESKGGSGGDNSGDPDREPEQKIAPVYSYATVAKLGDVSAKTLQNKAASGLIPKPLKTPIGPRFTVEQVQQILGVLPLPPQPIPDVPRRRGRPRIAALMGKKGGEA